MSPVPPIVPVTSFSILCADDNVLLGEVMVYLLRRAGHLAEHFGDGLMAWDRISHDLAGFDVVVTDHHMPGLNGTELVELLRDAGYAGRVVVHSSCFTDELQKKYRELGVTRFVPKTCKPESLLQAIEESRGFD